MFRSTTTPRGSPDFTSSQGWHRRGRWWSLARASPQIAAGASGRRGPVHHSSRDRLTPESATTSVFTADAPGGLPVPAAGWPLCASALTTSPYVFCSVRCAARLACAVCHRPVVRLRATQALEYQPPEPPPCEPEDPNPPGVINTDAALLQKSPTLVSTLAMTAISTKAAITSSRAYSTLAAPVWRCLMCWSLVSTSHPLRCAPVLSCLSETPCCYVGGTNRATSVPLPLSP